VPSDAAAPLDTVPDLAAAWAELDALRAERDAARAAAARANEELERLARMASHDLRAPLRTVKGFAALLSRRYAGRLDADADEYLGFLTAAAEQMDGLIADTVAQARAVARSG